MRPIHITCHVQIGEYTNKDKSHTNLKKSHSSIMKFGDHTSDTSKYKSTLKGLLLVDLHTSRPNFVIIQIK